MHKAAVRQPGVESRRRLVSLLALEPDAMKVACQVRTRGKGGDDLKALPMGIADMFLKT